jgi:spermidine synthase
MVYLAALCSGLGGLLIELVLLRRFGLLLGNTSGAADLVIGSFLLGLGVGGLLVPRLIGRLARPILAASAIYVAVALACALLDLLLERIPPLSFAAGIALLPLVPGIPTLLMGMAFPLIFFVFGDRRIRWRVGLLVAANLAGSLLATAFGGNLAIPEYGLRATALAGSGAYLAAAALLVRPGLRTRVPLAAGRRSAAGLPPLGRLAVFAALSGALVTGIQVFLLRRLTFFLEGWQPTISGVLAACLLGLTLGSGLGTGLFARWLRDRAPVTCLLLGALAANLGLQEHLVLRMSLLPMDSDLQLHAIIWLCAIVCAGLPCFFLGAVVPLCVARFDDPALRSALAGRLFFWQGVGSIVGTLGVGQIFPLLAPRTYYTVAPLLMGLATVALVVRALPPVVAAGCAALLLALATLGVSGAGSLLDPEAPLERPHRRYTNDYRYVDHRTDGTVTASVVWDRERYSMILFTNEFLATDTGPLASYMKVLGHLPFLLREDPRDVAVIAFGTGTTARSVTVWPVPGSVNLVEIAGAVIEMAPHFTGLGPRDDPPVPAFLEDPRTRVWLTDGRRFLARAPPRSLDMISMEPLLPYAPGTVSLYTREFYELAGRALSPTGLLVQWVPTQALPAAYYDSLLATFASSFAHHSVWFVDGATLLIGSHEPHLPDPAALDARLARAPEAARVALHEARITSSEDLLMAFVGDDLLAVTGAAPILHDDRPFIERVGIWKYGTRHRELFRPNARKLEELVARGGSGPWFAPAIREARAHRVRAMTWLLGSGALRHRLEDSRKALQWLEKARRILPDSVLLYGEETLALRLFNERLATIRGGRNVRDLALAHLARDPASPLLHAVLALPDRRVEALLPPAEAAARAVAVSPPFFQNPPPFLAGLSEVAPERSPLEALVELPEGSELAAAASADDALGVALRSVYPVRSANAILEVLATRPLDGDEQGALSSLLDPALLRRAERRIAERGGSLEDELLPLWREGLPRPDRLAPRSSGLAGE